MRRRKREGHGGHAAGSIGLPGSTGVGTTVGSAGCLVEAKRGAASTGVAAGSSLPWRVETGTGGTGLPGRVETGVEAETSLPRRVEAGATSGINSTRGVGFRDLPCRVETEGWPQTLLDLPSRVEIGGPLHLPRGVEITELMSLNLPCGVEIVTEK